MSTRALFDAKSPAPQTDAAAAPETPIMMGIDRTMPGTGVGWGKQSRDSRHMSVADPSKLKSSKPGSPATTASRPGSRQVESSSAMWLDRNPQEFLRMMRKTASEPQLLPAKPKRSAAADASGEKQSARKSEVRATDIIAAQKKADAEKEAKDLETAERNSYVFQQQYSQLVNQRVQKTAQCESLTEQAKQATKETELLEGEVEVLRYRLATLKHEVGAMEAEMVMEIDTTPRYEHMSRRSRKAVEQLADRCVKPQRELVELLTKMKRKGGSHLSTQFESEALLQAVERLGVQLQGRHKFNAKEIEQLKVESADAKESQVGAIGLPLIESQVASDGVRVLPSASDAFRCLPMPSDAFRCLPMPSDAF